MITGRYLVSLIRYGSGEEVRRSGARRVESSRSVFSVKPVPTLPA